MPQTVSETNHSIEKGWLNKMKCVVMFQYSICNMHFGIMKSELILGTSVAILKFLAINYSSSIQLGVRSRCLRIKRMI